MQVDALKTAGIGANLFYLFFESRTGKTYAFLSWNQEVSRFEITYKIW
jgi:hypothetical protein